MKKKIFSLILCIPMFAMDPLFAMETERPEDSKNITRIKLESIEYKKDDVLFPGFAPWMNIVYTLETTSLPSILKTPYQSNWPFNDNEGGENDKSYIFLIGEKQFELHIRDQPKEFLVCSNISSVFFPDYYWTEVTHEGHEGKSYRTLEAFQYFTTRDNMFIRELTLSPEDPMFAKGIKLKDDEKSILVEKVLKEKILEEQKIQEKTLCING